MPIKPPGGIGSTPQSPWQQYKARRKQNVRLNVSSVLIHLRIAMFLAPPKAGQKPARPPKPPKHRPANGEAAVCGSYEQRKQKRLFLDKWKASFCGSNMEQTHGGTGTIFG